MSGDRKFYCIITVGVSVESTLALMLDCDIRSHVANPQTPQLILGLRLQGHNILDVLSKLLLAFSKFLLDPLFFSPYVIQNLIRILNW